SATVATVKMRPANRTKALAATTIGLFIISFAACVAFTYPPGRPNVSFYIMPTRGWEFILGGSAPTLAALTRRLPAQINECLAFIGIVLIASAVVLFDAGTLYPSYWVTMPAAGTALIIIAGLTDPNNAIARGLATWPMTRIGLVSY